MEETNFTRLLATAILLFATGCGTQLNTLRSAKNITSGAGGVPPALTSLTLTDVSPTRHSPLALSWGIPVGTTTQYCLLENATDPLMCVWHSGAFPTTYVDSSADGLFSLTAYLKNDYGISDPVISNSITIDRTAPVLATATVGNADPTNNAVFSLAYGAITFAPYTEYCMQENNTAVTGCSWTSGPLPSTYTVLPTDGSKGISIWLRDAAGNVSSRVTTTAITYNGSTPTVAFTSPAAGGYANLANFATFAVTGTCSENGRNVVISGAASATVVCTGGSFNATLDLTAVAQGAFTLKADTTNAATTAAVQATRSFTKDSVAPTLVFSSPSGGSYVNAANVAAFAVNGTCTENGRNVVITGDASATVTCTGGLWSTNLDFTAAASGTVNVSVNHSDAAGNAATPLSRSFTKDVALPTVAFNTPAAGSAVNIGNVSTFAVTGTCSENTRNVVITGAATATVACSAGTWNASLDFTGAADGTVTIYANHSDAAGNAAAQATRSFTKSTGVPGLAITAPAAGTIVNVANVSAFAVSGTCTENGQNVVISGAATATAVCTAGAWNATLDFTAASQGSITIFADHTSSLGNPAVQVSRAFTKDTVVPTVVISTPAASSYVNIANVASYAVTGACSENTRNVVISGDASATVVCTAGGWSANLDFSAAAAGTVTIHVDHTDASGNAAVQASRNFIKDVTAPTVFITAPAAGTGVNLGNQASFAISGTCSDNGSNVVISGAGSATVTCAGGIWSTNVDLTAAGQGTITLYADQTDPAGNSATQDSRSFSKDSVAPTVAISLPTAGSYINSTNYTAFAVSGTCSENGRNVVLSGSASATTVCTAGAWSANLDFSAAADGAVTININHSDAAGNAATQATRAFTKDIVLPTLGTFAVLNNTPTPSQGYLLDFGTGSSEAISAYCILQNDTNVSHCAWTNSTSLPLSFTVSSAPGSNTLTAWVKDTAGNIQASGKNSGAVSYGNTLAISPTSTTLTAGISYDRIEGARSGVASVMLGNGKILYAGGCNTATAGTKLYFTVAKLYDPVADTWTYAGNLSVPRCYASAVKLADGRVMVAGGTTADNTSSKTVDIYDPTANSWSTTYPMATARSYATATLLASGKVLVAGGFTNTSATVRNSTEIYDPTTMVWISGPTMGASRFYHRAIALSNGTVLIVGGLISASNSTATTDIFTPSGNKGTIAAGPALNAKRGDFGAVLLSASESPTAAEAVMVLGGFDGNATYLNSVEIYNGTNWTTKNTFTTARRTLSVVKLTNGTIFISGGTAGGGAGYGTTGIYDPLGSSGSGTYTAKLSNGVWGSSGLPSFDSSDTLLANGKVLRVFGNATTGAGSPDVYDPVGNTWSYGTLPLHEAYPSYGQYPGPHLKLASGRILTCGWRSNITAESPHCAIIDPVKGVVLPTGDFVNGNMRGFGPLTELSDGRVLVAGGSWNGASQAQNTSEIYDPSTNAWTAKANMPYYGYGFRSAAYSTTKIIVTAGYTGSASNVTGPSLRTLIYNIAGNSWSAPASANLPTTTVDAEIVKTPTGRIFLYGGSDGTNALSRLLEWDDATTAWVARASSSTPRQQAGATYLPGGTAGKIFVVGGYTTVGANPTATSEIYDIGTDTWSVGATIPTSQYQADICAAYVPGVNQIYFVGNFVSGSSPGALYQYDVAGNSWTVGAVFSMSVTTGAHLLDGMACGVLNDGRFWNNGGEYTIIDTVNNANQVRYTASQGDGNYTFSITSGTGTLDARNIFTPTIPLVPATSSTIRVDDGGGQNASASASIP